MPFNIASYTSGNILTTANAALNYSQYHVTVTGTVVPSGLDLTVTVRNLTTGNLPSINALFPIGWGASGVEAAPTNIWLADYSYKRGGLGSGYVDDSRASEFGQNYFESGAVNRSLSMPVVAVDAGTRIVSASTNYPYYCSLRAAMISGSTYGLLFRSYRTYYAGASVGFEAPRDFFSSGETRSWNFWFREASGYAVTTGVAVSMQQPFVDWIGSAHPNMRPPKVSGKIYGFFMAANQGSATGNPRNYISTSGVNPWSGSTWSDILNNHIPSVSDLKSRGYNGIMIWCAGGWNYNDVTFAPADFRILPKNLKDSISEFRDWGKAHDLKMYIYQGGGYSYFQTGDWDSTVQYGENDITYFGGPTGVPQFSLATAVKPSLNVTGIIEWQKNNRNGWFIWADGMGLDATLDVIKNSGMIPILQELRSMYPDKMIISENFRTIVDQCYRPATVYPPSYFEPYRCPLQEVIHPGFQNFIILNRFEYTYDNSGRDAWINTINQAESVGLSVITLTDPATFYFLPQSGVVQTVNFPNPSGKYLTNLGMK